MSRNRVAGLSAVRLLIAFSLAALSAGCAAMRPANPAVPIPLDEEQHAAVEQQVVTYFTKVSTAPASAQMHLTRLQPAAVPGWQDGRLEVTDGAQSQAVDFLVSNDGRYLFRGDVVDLTVDPIQAALARIDLRGQPVRGDVNAPIAIVAYFDFQCPFCARVSKSLEGKILAAYPNKVKIVYKNLPLGQIHSWAEQGALAGECAFQQGNEIFWKVHDDIYGQQKQITARTLRDIAARSVKKAGGDGQLFLQCFDSHAAQAAVEADLAEAAALGINSTPTFFINGRKVAGAQPIEGFKTIIDEELNRH